MASVVGWPGALERSREALERGDVEGRLEDERKGLDGRGDRALKAPELRALGARAPMLREGGPDRGAGGALGALERPLELRGLALAEPLRIKGIHVDAVDRHPDLVGEQLLKGGRLVHRHLLRQGDDR